MGSVQLYAAGATLLGLGWLYTKSQEYRPPPVVVRNSDSDLVSIDLMQKKQWLYGGNPTSNLPLGMQQRKLPDYTNLSHGQILQSVRADYNKTVSDQSQLQTLVAKSVHAGQIVQPTAQNGRNMQITMQPGGGRTLIVEPYSRSGFSSTTTALATTGLGGNPVLQPM
jgi:hypothetical protein